MTIQKQFYLSCDECDKIYESKPDDAQGLEDEALDDGWIAVGDMGTDSEGTPQSLHICQDCT